MRRFIYCFAILSCCSLGFAQETKTVTLKEHANKVGDVFHTKSSGNTEGDIDYFNTEDTLLGKMHQTQVGSTDQVVTVLAINDKADATKIEVKVNDKRLIREQTRGAGERDISPLIDKTLILELKGKEISVTDKAGKALSEKEIARAKADYADILQPKEKEHGDIIPDRPIKIGESFSVSGKEGLAFLEEEERKSTKSLTFKYTLVGQKKVAGLECAIFKVETKMVSIVENGMEMTMSQKGEVSMVLAGKYESTSELKGTIAIKGKMTAPNGQVIKIVGKTSLVKSSSLTVTNK